jgi:Fic family protein
MSNKHEYTAKFNLTATENIFVAKRNIVDYIWKSARLEGIEVTFPETYAIIEKARVANVNVGDILKITNLKHAWQTVIDTLNEPLTLDNICRIHADVARDDFIPLSELRTGKVYISGTDYVPPIPTKESANAILEEVEAIQSHTEQAIVTMFKLMKAQLFWDGNKRTSMLAANKLMIQNGCGIISVPNEKLEEFNVIMSDYYTNDTLDNAVDFVYDNCIDGIDFRLQEKLEKEKEEKETAVTYQQPHGRGR